MTDNYEPFPSNIDNRIQKRIFVGVLALLAASLFIWLVVARIDFTAKCIKGCAETHQKCLADPKASAIVCDELDKGCVKYCRLRR